MLQEPWMFGKIIILAMFENEDSIFVQQVAIQYEVWDLREFFQGVRWVGKDEVELRPSSLRGLEVAEDIRLQDLQAPFLLQLASDGANEERVLLSLLKCDHTATASGDELC